MFCYKFKELNRLIIQNRIYVLTMSDINVIDFLKCRICLQADGEMDSFFNIYYEDLSLAKVFKNITSYEVEEDDRLPKNICITCRTAIINFNNMVSIFQDTETYFKKMLCKQESEGFETEAPMVENEDNYETCENKSDIMDINESYYEEEVNSFGTVAQDINSKKLGSDMMEVKKRQNFVCEQSVSNNGEYKYVNSVKYVCECGDSFLYKMGFRHHMQFRHNTVVEEEELEKYSEPIKLTIPQCFSNPVEYVSPRQLLKRDKLQCRICNAKFETEDEVKTHEEVHKTHICDQCGAAFLKKHYLQDHQLMHSEERRYRCKVCGKAFKHRHTLSVHKKTHEDARGFVCEVCGDSFRARATLYTHTILKHSNVKNFPCPNCNLRFNLKSSRDKHYVRKHTFNREKSFVCSKCGAAYLNKTTLTRHIADKHLGQAKYYPCTICENKTYVMKKGLRTHMMKKHGIYDT